MRSLPVIPGVTPRSATAGLQPVRPGGVAGFSARQRAALLGLARAVIPAHGVLPAPSFETIDRLERLLHTLAPGLPAGYPVLLSSAAALCMLHQQRRLADLTEAEGEAFVTRLFHGNLVERSLLRGLTLPIKAAYFDDPVVYAALGQRHRPGVPSHETARARVTPSDQPPFVKHRTVCASSIPYGEELACDVVVVGSGAGGAVAAYELAAAGHAVILVEEGLFFGREDFSGGALAMQKLLYRDLGLSASIGNVPIMLPTGRCVGGTTTVNSGTCYRAKDRVLQGWQEQLGLTAHGPEQLAPFYERVEAVLGVEVAATKYLGHAAEAIARGATRLGYTHQPLRRNAPDCDGQGLCCFGCPTDAKRSTNVSYVPMALRAGAELIVNARVQRLLIEDGTATGVEVVAGSAPSGHVSSLSRFRVRARAVVLACGTFGTATLLQSDPVAQRMLSRSGALGQNLTIHPTSGVFAEFDTPMQTGRFIPQSYAIEEFHDQGLLMEGVSTPLDLTALNSPLVGRVYSEVMEAYPRTAGFGFLLEDSTTGSVQPGPAGRPLIRYNLTGRDIKRIQHGLRLLCDLFFAAGSYRVQLPVRGFDLIRSDEKSRLDALQHAAIPASDFFLTAYHPLGTARMSSSPTSGIVNEDLAAHDLPGLYIMDGSVVPSSPAVNPQLTIMALASRAAQRLAERLNQPAS